MKTGLFYFLIFCIFNTSLMAISSPVKAKDKTKIVIVKNRSQGPETMATGGLKDMLLGLNCELVSELAVQLTTDEERQYGDWNRAALENRHLGSMISGIKEENYFVVGLLTNCVDVLGMLSGLQHSILNQLSKRDARDLQNTGLAGRKPLRVGLIWIDAHADFNTPETSLSGMLGGMPVAIAAGMCLNRIRLQTGLDPFLPTKYIVMAGLRDVDPLEQALLDQSFCELISVQDIKTLSDNIHTQMKRLSRITDIIYVHIDMDVLDPSEVGGHPLTVDKGPTSGELAAALKLMFQYEKAVAIGIASLPHGDRDKEGKSLKAAYRLIEGTIHGIQNR